MEEIRNYPTLPDTDGFFIESEDDETLDVFTKVYDNGNKIKRAVLPACGKTAVVRELLGKDTIEIKRFTGDNLDNYQMAAVTVATTVDGNRQPYEYYEVMKLKDYSRLAAMFQSLNF